MLVPSALAGIVAFVVAVGVPVTVWPGAMTLKAPPSQPAELAAWAGPAASAAMAPALKARAVKRRGSKKRIETSPLVGGRGADPCPNGDGVNAGDCTDGRAKQPVLTTDRNLNGLSRSNLTVCRPSNAAPGN